MYLKAVRGSKACTRGRKSEMARHVPEGSERQQGMCLKAVRHVPEGSERQQGMYLNAVRGSKACTCRQ